MDMNAQPNTQSGKRIYACSACRRRKLKCDRSPQGCEACTSSNLPCVYSLVSEKSNKKTSRQTTRRTPRGPYRKEKTLREKELEHLVDHLQQKCTDLEMKLQPSDIGSVAQSRQRTPFSHTPTVESCPNPPRPSLSPPQSSETINHPPAAQILELWVIYMTSVDHLTKIIHCPTFTHQILHAKVEPQNVSRSTEAIMFSIYYAAVSTLDPSEVLRRFTASKDRLLSAYQSILMGIVTQATDFSFEMLQALLIHASSLRRQSGSAIPATEIFNIAIQKARQLHLDRASLYDVLPPFQAEYRRRAWWTICRYESADVEESKSRDVSIMYTTDVPLPSNLDDLDLYPEMTSPIVARVGLTDFSLILMMFKMVRLIASLAAITRFRATEQHTISVISTQTLHLAERFKSDIQQTTLRYCEVTRPFDCLILLTSRILMSKIEVLLLEPPLASDQKACDAFHDAKIAYSLDVIECHQLWMTDERLEAWHWYAKHVHQWSSTMYVLEELTRRPDAAFASRAWLLLEMTFRDTELLNKHGIQSAHRTKLLEAYANALKAREELLKTDAYTTAATLPLSHLSIKDSSLATPCGLESDVETTTRVEAEQSELAQSDGCHE